MSTGDGSVTYKKESIYDTGLPIIVIDDNKRFSKYPQIGYGEEGSIHKYDNKRAIKVFEFLEEKELTDESHLTKKIDPRQIKGEIEFKNVKFGYDDSRIIIKNFSV